jgi:hypothetical protein
MAGRAGNGIGVFVIIAICVPQQSWLKYKNHYGAGNQKLPWNFCLIHVKKSPGEIHPGLHPSSFY